MGYTAHKFKTLAPHVFWMCLAWGGLSACQNPEASKPAAAESLIAVATNFRAGFEALETEFERQSPHRIDGVYGGTGQLFTQIMNGANYHAFLAADKARPQKLTAERRGVTGAPSFVYAQGRLALWTRLTRGTGKNGWAQSYRPAKKYGAHIILKQEHITSLAIANPKLAPYGAAAMETLKTLGIGETLERGARLGPRIVQGENVGQAFALTATGNAQAGLVALADAGRAVDGIYWEVPAYLHGPIDQSAILLSDAPAARAFLEYLRTPAARDIIRAHGYAIAQENSLEKPHEP